MYFQIGDTVGDYEIIGVLGEGGMGKVYKVRNVIAGRMEAMKILLPDLSGDPELADRFLREIKVQASLEHHNIAALRTALRVENQLIMVMEYVEGQTLVDLLEQGPIPLRTGVDYICQALSALGYAHERGVIHRDIKPANIMVTPDGVVKLMDFGIAKVAANQKLTMTGVTMGSLHYMSPEQIKGVTTLDPRSDLYSLGVTLYEVATGTRPFRGDSDYAIMTAHLEQKPAPPIEVESSVPEPLNEIILKAIEKDPTDRFQNAGAFRTALQSILGELPAVESRALPRVQAVEHMMLPVAEQPAAETMAPPRAAPPAPAFAPPPPTFVPAPAPEARRGGRSPHPPGVMPPPPSRRGLYMLAGSVLTLVLLIAAGIQVANWRKTKANSISGFGQSGLPASGAQPDSTQSGTPQPGGAQTGSSQPGLAQPGLAQSGSAQSGAAVEAIGPGANTPATSASPLKRLARPTPGSPTGQLGAGSRPGAGAAPAAQPAMQQPAAQAPGGAPQAAQNATPAPSAENAAPASAPSAAPAPAAPSADAAALQELRERMINLVSRANAVRSSMENMERQQRAAGLGMRPDMAAAGQRVQFLMGEANGALGARDAAAAKRNMDLAERDIEKLEGFLGR